MTDSTNEKRPVRKLTVKNFSVIKEAELEFGKITVLIGPQASGKSLLCKLAYFLGQIVPEIANGLALVRLGTRELLDTISREFQERFPPYSWGDKPGQIEFSSELGPISLSTSPEGTKCVPNVYEELLEKYAKWVEVHGVEGSAKEVTHALRTGEVGAVGPFRFDESIYIPTGRGFFSSPNRGFTSMSRRNLDWITQRFSNEIDWEYRAMLEPSSSSSDLLPQFIEDASGILGGKVVRTGQILLFKSTRDNRGLPFQWLSSGTQELLPLVNPLANLVYNVSSNPLNVWEPFSPRIGPIYIEEPELSIFPNTQYELMRLLAWLASEERLEFPFVITTHSPYILSAFDNLIKAGVVGNSSEEHREAVSKIVDKRYWVRPEDFRAYKIADGKLESIYKNETGDLDADYLDNVSGKIAEEFTNLLEIQYGG
jgi:hypothetical protein